MLATSATSLDTRSGHFVVAINIFTDSRQPASTASSGRRSFTPARSQLFSDGEYVDFHLRAAVKINSQGMSGIRFHSEYGNSFDLAPLNGAAFSPISHEVAIRPKSAPG